MTQGKKCKSLGQGRRSPCSPIPDQNGANLAVSTAAVHSSASRTRRLPPTPSRSPTVQFKLVGAVDVATAPYGLAIPKKSEKLAPAVLAALEEH